MSKKIPAIKADQIIPKNWEKRRKRINNAAERGVRSAAQYVLDAAIPITPEDTRALRSSGKVDSSQSDTGAEAAVGFGGRNKVTPTANAPTGYVNYAIEVHEDIEGNYRVGGPKFLQNAADSTKEKQEDLIIKELKSLK